MRFPFVSRETSEARLTEKDTEIRRWQERYDALLAHVTDLSRDLLTRTVPTPLAVPARTKDDVIEAILTRAAGNGQLRALLSQWAMQQRKAGVSDDAIIPNILVWKSPDEEDDNAT